MEESFDSDYDRELGVVSKIELEIWSAISGKLQSLLIRLSLVEHLSPELLGVLLGDDAELREEFKQHCSFISFNKYIDAFLIQHLFRDFLCTKQHLLSDSERRDTYKAAARWSEQNGFLADALSYYEKLGDLQAKRVIEAKLESRIIDHRAD